MLRDPVVTIPSRGRPIIIGSAYTPPRNARYGDPLEVHPVTRRGHRAVLVVSLVVLAAFALGRLL